MKSLLCVLLVATINTGMLAQDTTGVNEAFASPPTVKLYRDPHKARVLGTIFPGAGHIYAGEYLRGYGYYLGTVGGVGMGVMVFIVDRCTFSFLNATSCDPGPQWPHQALGIAMVGAGLWSWISSARDAAHAAERANASHEHRKLSVKPLIEPASEPNARLHAGLKVAW
jgi:hypothetical protein